MDPTLFAVVVAVLALVLIRAGRKLYDPFSIGRTVGVLAGDGGRYQVHASHGESRAAADVMAELNLKAVELMRHLRKKYLRGRSAPAGAAGSQRPTAVRRLLARYDPDNLVENSPRNPDGDTSYTIDKGGVLAFCIREKFPERTGDPELHDFHELGLLTFVLVHELSHIAIDEVGHPPEFWSAFKFMLEEAAEAGILAPADFAARPENYCGIVVDYNPLLDPGLPAMA